MKKIEEELLRLLSRVNEPVAEQPLSTFRERLWGVLNSTFFLTIFGGIIVGCISIILQARISENSERVARRQAFRAAQITVMTEFADGMARWLGCSQDVVKRAIWIRKSHHTEKRLFPDGRSFEQTRDIFEKTATDLAKLPQPDSLCAKAKAMFKAAPLHQAIDELDTQLNVYQHAKDGQTFYQAFSFIEKQYQVIVELMGKEVQHEVD